jgi:hypothetical protein
MRVGPQRKCREGFIKWHSIYFATLDPFYSLQKKEKMTEIRQRQGRCNYRVTKSATKQQKET